MNAPPATRLHCYGRYDQYLVHRTLPSRFPRIAATVPNLHQTNPAVKSLCYGVKTSALTRERRAVGNAVDLSARIIALATG
jgi:hypothetical protein